MEELEDMEEDAGLGNGGLGRLAGEHPFTLPIYPIQGGFTDINDPLFHIRASQSFLLVLHLLFSLFPGLHGFTGSGCVRLWHSL